MIFICERTAYLITSHDGHETVKEELPALKSSQEETYASYCMSIMQEPETTVLFESRVPIQMCYIMLHHQRISLYYLTQE